MSELYIEIPLDYNQNGIALMLAFCKYSLMVLEDMDTKQYIKEF